MTDLDTITIPSPDPSPLARGREPTGKLAAALAKAQGAFGTPIKDHTATVEMRGGGSYSYSYSTLAATLACVREPLAQNGLALVQAPTVETVTTTIADKLYRTTTVTVTTQIMHHSGEYLEFPPLTGEAANATIQAIGSMITYLRRYSLASYLMLASDDDDGQAGMPPGPRDDQETAPDKVWRGAQDGVEVLKGRPPSDGSDRQVSPEAVIAAVPPPPSVVVGPPKSKRQRLLDACDREGLIATDLRSILAEKGLPATPKDLTEAQVLSLEGIGIPEYAAKMREPQLAEGDFLADPDEEEV